MDRFEHFTLSIFSISRYWNKIATEEMKKYGLRGAYALYLVMLASYEGRITAAKLADLCQRDKADVSRALSAFHKEGRSLRTREGSLRPRSAGGHPSRCSRRDRASPTRCGRICTEVSTL